MRIMYAGYLAGTVRIQPAALPRLGRAVALGITALRISGPSLHVVSAALEVSIVFFFRAERCPELKQLVKRPLAAILAPSWLQALQRALLRGSAVPAKELSDLHCACARLVAATADALGRSEEQAADVEKSAEIKEWRLVRAPYPGEGYFLRLVVRGHQQVTHFCPCPCTPSQDACRALASWSSTAAPSGNSISEADQHMNFPDLCLRVLILLPGLDEALSHPAAMMPRINTRCVLRLLETLLVAGVWPQLDFLPDVICKLTFDLSLKAVLKVRGCRRAL